MVLLVARWHLLPGHQRDEPTLRGLLVHGTLMVDGVSEGLIGEDLLDLVDVRVVLIVDLDLAGIDELAVTADGRIGVLVRDHILRSAMLLEFVEDYRRRLIGRDA